MLNPGDAVSACDAVDKARSRLACMRVFVCAASAPAIEFDEEALSGLFQFICGIERLLEKADGYLEKMRRVGHGKG